MVKPSKETLNIFGNEKEANSSSVTNCNSEPFFSDSKGVSGCKPDLSKYFHPSDRELMDRFKAIYKIFGLNDQKLSDSVGIHKSTMSRYRRGVFIPTIQMKIEIAKALSKIAGYHIDSSLIWGEDLIFEKWRVENDN